MEGKREALVMLPLSRRNCGVCHGVGGAAAPVGPLRCSPVGCACLARSWAFPASQFTHLYINVILVCHKEIT